MGGIIPVPILRSSDMLVQQRLLQQVTSDQLDLLKIQDQLSTGRRLQVTSQDAPASVRAMGLQRLNEQKGQSLKNLEATQSYLAASDAAVNGVSGLIIDVRALAISMVDNTKTSIERDAAVTEINRAVEQLVNNSNQQFRGRFLFSGSDASLTPYSSEGDFVVFHGNEGTLQSYADVGLRFDSNVSGNEVFGGLSPGKQGSVDFQPLATEDTRLSELRGGLGISQTSILVSDGENDQVVDISSAETVGDVIDLIEANPPEGRRVTARIAGRGLVLSIDPDGGGNLNVREVGGGTSAAELGIYEPEGVGVNDLVGAELKPLLTLTTKLTDTLGARASALLKSDGLVDRNNDIYFEALDRGESGNGISIQYVNDHLLQAAAGLPDGDSFAQFSETAVAARAALTFSGSNNNLVLTADTPGAVYNDVRIEVVNGGTLGAAANAAYDPDGKVLTIEIDISGNSQIQNVINAIDANTPFSAAYDASVAGDGGFTPTANVPAADINTVSGNTGNSGGDADTLFIHIDPGLTRAKDVIEALDAATGIDGLLQYGLDAKDEEGFGLQGEGLVQEGARIVTAGGSGLEFDQSSGFQIVNGRETHTIDIQSAETVEDLLNILNGSPAHVHAEINVEGKGINVRSRLSGSDFQIGENGGLTATQLGIRTFVADTGLGELNYGAGVNTINGSDFTIRRTDGVELDLDVSSAVTVQDVLELINNHGDNQDAGRVEARLASAGNGIQLVEEAPNSGAPLTVIKSTSSDAAWDLGLVARGEKESYSTAGATPQPAVAKVTFASPNHRDTAFNLISRQEGTNYNGIQVVIESSGSSKVPTVTFDDVASELRIVIDPTQTTTADIVTALSEDASQPFTAELGLDNDPNNDGSELIPTSGPVGLTSGGVLDPTAKHAEAEAAFPAPDHLNSSLLITASTAGPIFNDVEVIFQDTGGPASATYDDALKTLTIDIQAGVTTANDVVAALTAVPEFAGSLNTADDSTNDGSGLVREDSFTTSGGAPETFSGADVNALEVKSIFNTLIKLSDALGDFDLVQIERLVAEIDEDFRRVNFARADVGAREQSLDALRDRLQGEQIELERTISLEIDVDLVKTISDLTARQAAFEASLRLIGQTFQLSLLQFI